MYGDELRTELSHGCLAKQGSSNALVDHTGGDTLESRGKWLEAGRPGKSLAWALDVARNAARSSGRGRRHQ